MAPAKRNMLPPDDGDYFFHLFLPLLGYADLKNPIIIGDSPDMMRRAEIYWKDPSRIDTYIDDIDHKRTSIRISLTEEDREILRSWKRFQYDVFYLASHRSNGSLLVDRENHVYRVLGLQSSLEELLPKTPVEILTAILPWKDVLITDGLFLPITIENPDEIKKKLQRICKRALEQGTVITRF